MHYIVCENLQALKNIKWLSRVPLKIKAAQNLVIAKSPGIFIPSKLAGYSYLEVFKTYGEIKQRWLVVKSEKRQESDRERLENKIQKDYTEADKALSQLASQKFACIPDAERAAQKLLKKSSVSRTHLN